MSQRNKQRMTKQSGKGRRSQRGGEEYEGRERRREERGGERRGVGGRRGEGEGGEGKREKRGRREERGGGEREGGRRGEDGGQEDRRTGMTRKSIFMKLSKNKVVKNIILDLGFCLFVIEKQLCYVV